MNLLQITAGVVSAVNPMLGVTVRLSNGYTQDANFKRVPAFTDVPAMAQVQALSFRDIQQIDGLNLNGSRKAIYVEGNIDGLVRPDKKGGDLIVFPDGTTWLVAMVLESWLNNRNDGTTGWVKVAATLQNGA